MPEINNEFSADQERQMRSDARASRNQPYVGKSKSNTFTPQPETRPVNITGRTGDGNPAQLRSESTERAQIKASNARMGTSEPASLLRHLVSPQSASLQDAIYSGNRKKLDATGPEE